MDMPFLVVGTRRTISRVFPGFSSPSYPPIDMIVFRGPLLRVEVRVPIMGSVPYAVLKGVCRDLECGLREITLAFLVFKLNRTESYVIA